MPPPDTTAADVLALIDAWAAKAPRRPDPQPQQRSVALQPRTEAMTLAARIGAQIVDLDTIFVELSRQALERQEPHQVEMLAALAIRCARQSAASLKSLAEAGLLHAIASGTNGS